MLFNHIFFSLDSPYSIYLILEVRVLILRLSPTRKMRRSRMIKARTKMTQCSTALGKCFVS